MRFLGGFLATLLLAGAPGLARGEDDPLKQALALQSAIEKVIAKAEPAIACILVSRSQKYQDKEMSGFQHFRPSGEPGPSGG